MKQHHRRPLYQYGYRLTDIDIEDNEFVFDGCLNGELVGLAIKF